MCDFCEKMPKTAEEHMKALDNAYGNCFIEPLYDNEGNFAFFGLCMGTAYGQMIGYLQDIKFCPMCGRKLSEETEKPSTEELLTRLKEKMTEGDYRTLQNGIKLFSDGVNALWSVLGKRIDEND